MGYKSVVRDIYSNAMDIIRGWQENDWNKPDSWVEIGISLAEIIDGYKDIDGKIKKKIVIETIIQILSDENNFKNINIDDRKKVVNIVKLILPTSLDYIIMATKGELKINTPLNINCCCFSKNKDK